MNNIMTKTALFLTLLAHCCSLLAAPQAVVDDRLIRAVNSNHQQRIQTLERQTEILQEQLRTQVYLKELNDNDHSFGHRENWAELEELGQKARLLMENNLATFDEYEAFVRYLSAKINNSVWENCLKTLNCEFAKVKLGLQSKELTALKHSALEVKETREQLFEMQQHLLKLSEESSSAEGYAALLDALLKISQSSAQSLNLLSKQLNTLLTLKINELSAKKLENQTEQAIEERFVKIGTVAEAVKHFDLRVSPYVK
ncbi:MAG: hypothetical protein K6F05_06145 [Succinivibrio sp.]|nr:hypothetical protein [Succinivibrio sp.]